MKNKNNTVSVHGENYTINDLLQLVWRKKRHFALSMGLSMVFIIIFVLFMPNQYSSKVVALPPSSSGDSGMLAQLSPALGIAGIPDFSNGDASVNEIMAILQSRKLADGLIDKFDLENYYKKKTRDDTRAAFTKDFESIYDRKSGKISFGYTHTQPRIAYEVTQQASELLSVNFNVLNKTSAQRQVDFLLQRIEMIQVNLENETKDFLAFQIRAHAIDPTEQAKAMIEAAGRLQGLLSEYEVEYNALSAMSAGENNPNLQMAKAKKEEVLRQLLRLFGGEKNSDVDFGSISIKEFPQISAEFLNRMKNIRRLDAVLQSLQAQLESAQIKAVKDSDPIVIIDSANMPERKSGPFRSLICIAWTIASFFITFLIILIANKSEWSTAETSVGQGNSTP